MAVYTQLDPPALARLIARYDVGSLLSAKGIAEGVSNSNWLIETTGGTQGGGATRFVLTLYERRIDSGDLPFFLALLDHLALKACPVPHTVHTRSGEAVQTVYGKAAALIQFLPGISVEHPSPEQASNVGRALAGIHLAASDFPLRREQGLGLPAWRALVEQAGADGLARIDPALPELLHAELSFLQRHWPDNLPAGIIHSDLFPDNVLMLGEEVSGLIDFYFAAHDFLAYDLAVTHAAWCFIDEGRSCCPDLSAALLRGYEEVRPLTGKERAALPVLARGAAMRFIASRVADWLDTPPGAVVQRRDPLEFVRRLLVYRRDGAAIFTSTDGGAKGGA